MWKWESSYEEQIQENSFGTNKCGKGSQAFILIKQKLQFNIILLIHLIFIVLQLATWLYWFRYTIFWMILLDSDGAWWSTFPAKITLAIVVTTNILIILWISFSCVAPFQTVYRPINSSRNYQKSSTIVRTTSDSRNYIIYFQKLYELHPVKAVSAPKQPAQQKPL